jgi:hypothetical protein
VRTTEKKKSLIDPQTQKERKRKQPKKIREFQQKIPLGP